MFDDQKVMAALPPYVGVGTQTGSKENIWVQFGPFLNVGSGSVTAFSDYFLSFAGQIDTPIFKGNLDLSLTLTAQDSNSPAGPCQLVINGTVFPSANYSVSGRQLFVSAQLPDGVQQTISIQQGGTNGRETYLGLSGKYNHEIHLAPSS
jgi:hypothetical protein